MRRFEFKYWDKNGFKCRKMISANSYQVACDTFKIEVPDGDVYDCVEVDPE